MAYQYKAACLRVIDGDTAIFDVDLGYRVHLTLPIRLFGINAPEMVGESRTAGMAARDYLVSLIEGKDVELLTFRDKQEKYGRYLAEIMLWNEPQGKSINDRMIEAGHAVAYMTK